MKIVMMNGGLGNQAFQYIFSRYLDIYSNDSCIIDDIFFKRKKVSHNGYELEKIFPIKVKKLSDMLDGDVIEEILALRFVEDESENSKIDMVTILNSCGLDLRVIQEANLYENDNKMHMNNAISYPINEYSPEIVRHVGNYYYYGYWINGRWFAGVKDIICKEFTFPDPRDKMNKMYLKDISSSEKSIAVHIRRGDFIDIGWLLNPTFYEKCVNRVKEFIDNPIFYVFSDDTEWVKNHMNEYGFYNSDEVVFVEGNVNGKNYIDMQLMASCRGMIIANSSFSYLAALLNRREDRFVLNPTKREII